MQREKLLSAEGRRDDMVDIAERHVEAHRGVTAGKRTLIEDELAAPSVSGAMPVPGQRTLVERLVEDQARPQIVGPALDRFRAQALTDVLDALSSVRGGASLIEATRSAAGQSMRPQERALSRGAAPYDPAGEALWRATERRAATLYRRATSDDAQLDDAAVDEALRALGDGRPLPARVRERMERGLGVALDRVRIHTDSVAARAACAVRAEAFTVGEDIFFADGAFAPETERGSKLLAHELAHVVQGWQGRTAIGAGMRVSEPGDALEREADAVAERVSKGVGRPGPPRQHPQRPPTTTMLLRHPSGSARNELPIEAQRFLQVVQARYGAYVEILEAAYPGHRTFVGTAADDLVKRDLKFALGEDFSSATVRLSRTNKTNADASALEGKLIIELAIHRDTHGTPNDPKDEKARGLGQAGRHGKTAAVIAGGGDTRADPSNVWYRSSAKFTKVELQRLVQMARRLAALPDVALPAHEVLTRYQRRDLRRPVQPPSEGIRGPKGAAIMNAAAAAVAAGMSALNNLSVRFAMERAWEQKQGQLAEWQLGDVSSGVLVTFVTHTPHICGDVCPVTFSHVEISRGPDEAAARTRFKHTARLMRGDVDEHYHHVWVEPIAKQFPVEVLAE